MGHRHDRLGHAFFALLIAGATGFFGTLRTVFGMPMRFWVIPLVSFFYVKLSIACLYYESLFVIFCAGMVYTVAFAVPVFRLFKRDFAKTIPPWICKGCGYPLMGLTGPRCPECGEPFDPDRVPNAADLPPRAADRLE